jgi:hypothetical protein
MISFRSLLKGSTALPFVLIATSALAAPAETPAPTRNRPAPIRQVRPMTSRR